MSDKGGKMCRIESIRLSIKEHLTSVGEEILCVLEKQSGVSCVKLVRVFVSERLGLAAEFMFNLFQREIETLETLLERRNKLLDLVLQPHVKLHRTELPPEQEKSSSLVRDQETQPPQHEERSSSLVQEEPQPPQIKEEPVTLPCQNAFIVIPNIPTHVLHHPVCKEDSSPEKLGRRSPNLFQEEPESPQIKEEQEELLQRPVDADGPTLPSHDVLHHPVCKEDSFPGKLERSASLFQEEPESPQIKEEQEELFPRPVEADVPTMTLPDTMREDDESPLIKEEQLLQRPVDADGPTMTLPDTVSEDDDNEETEPLASISPEHVTTQADVEDYGTSQPTSRDNENGGTEPVASTSTEHAKTQADVEDFQKHTKTRTGETPLVCSICGKGFSRKVNLKKHMKTHLGKRPFSCTVCGKCFTRRYHLKRHVASHVGERTSEVTMTHTQERPFTGSGCGETSHLKKHTETRTGESPFVCSICGEGCSICPEGCRLMAHLKEHMQTHLGERPFMCSVCGKCFTRRSHLKRHAESHKGRRTSEVMRTRSQMDKLKRHVCHIGERPFRCTICGKYFTRRFHLKRHMESHKGQRTSEVMKNMSEDHETGETEPVASTSAVLMKTQADVEDCGTSQPTHENRETDPIASTSTEHVKTQADVENFRTSQSTSDDDRLLSSHCSESDSEASDEWEPGEEQSAVKKLKSHKTQNVEGERLSQDPTSSKQTHSTSSHAGKKNYTCLVCGKSCGTKSHLEAHVRTHTGERPFTCNVCAKGFVRKDVLKLHMRTHTGEKPFACTFCGKMFSLMGNLKTHTMIHTGERPLTCAACGKSFIYKHDLNRHMRMHAGEKPCTCTVCGKACSRKSHLKIHMRIHTGEKTFTCRICGKGCNDLKSHMRTHTGEKPFTCRVCGKSFSQSGSLKSHMMTHTGEKPYTCSVCGKGCSSLRKHMMTHTGQKPYTCSVCGQGCREMYHLKKHMETHTGEAPFVCSICGEGCSICTEGCSRMVHLKRHMKIHLGKGAFRVKFV